MTSVSIRPSDARREALKEADAEMGGGRGVPLVSNFFPIDRYYNAADKVLLSFEHAYEERRLDDAYVYGKRFAAFSLDALPKHNYYRLPKYAKWRKKNGQDMANVIQKLETVAKWMDQEELQREALRKRQLALHQEQIRKQKQEERAKMRELQQKIEQRRKEGSSKSTNSKVANSALSKLEKLNTLYPTDKKPGEDRSSRMSDYERHSSASLSGTSRHDSSNDDGLAQSLSLSGSNLNYNDSDSLLPYPVEPLPPPVPPPTTAQEANFGFRIPTADQLFPPPPSYNQISRPPSYNQAVQDVTKKNNNHLFPPTESLDHGGSSSWPLAAPAGGATVDGYANGSVVVPSDQRLKPTKPARPVPVRKLKDQYTNEYRRLIQSKKIGVFGLDTYQGRYRCSTNGCTVISPLVVSQHLKSRHAISDSAICDVIDNLCGPILRDIRNKLQLEGDALIIPSDVHDYMVDRHILKQEQFTGASGGNILDEEHVGEFLKLLQKGEKGEHQNKRAGAALFFREHVVSIVKVPISGGFSYDLVDSMPGMVDPKNSNNRMATRTRCKDLACLRALLKWYACNKFSDSNLAYIDQNGWDECMADFDPRVFQAFVWAEV